MNMQCFTVNMYISVKDMNMFKPLMKAMPATELYIYIYSFWDGSGIKI